MSNWIYDAASSANNSMNTVDTIGLWIFHGLWIITFLVSIVCWGLSAILCIRMLSRKSPTIISSAILIAANFVLILGHASFGDGIVEPLPQLSIGICVLLIITLIAFPLVFRGRSRNRVSIPNKKKPRPKPKPAIISPEQPQQVSEIKDPTAFLQACARAGINTSDRSLEDIARDVVNFASPTVKSRLNPNQSLEEQAMFILTGEI